MSRWETLDANPSHSSFPRRIGMSPTLIIHLTIGRGFCWPFGPHTSPGGVSGCCMGRWGFRRFVGFAKYLPTHLYSSELRLFAHPSTFILELSHIVGLAPFNILVRWSRRKSPAMVGIVGMQTNHSACNSIIEPNKIGETIYGPIMGSKHTQPIKSDNGLQRKSTGTPYVLKSHCVGYAPRSMVGDLLLHPHYGQCVC